MRLGENLMKIFILLCIGLFLSSCQSNFNKAQTELLITDLKMAALTVDSEEEFRNIVLLKMFKTDVEKYKYEFTVDVPINIVSQRINHCYSDGQLFNSRQAWAAKALNDKLFDVFEIINYKNTFAMVGFHFLYELDEIENGSTKVVWLQNAVFRDINDEGKRIHNFALGISEGPARWSRTCNF